MDKICDLFLEALRASLQQNKVSWKTLSLDEWRGLFWLAKKHSVLPLIYEAVYDCPAAKKEPEFMKEVTRKAIRIVAEQTKKTEEFLELYEKLGAAGLKPIVMKGLVCRNVYPYPEHRPSSDEDICIPSETFRQCHQEMLDFGMYLLEPEKDTEKEFEVPYRKEQGKLYVEVHKRLFPEEKQVIEKLNQLFEGYEKRTVEETIQGVSIRTLGYTDHFLFLFYHAYKHFLFAGCGIRLLCDMVMFANAYGDKIDWEYIGTQVEIMGTESFFRDVLRIGEKHLTLEKQKAGYPTVWTEGDSDISDLLIDILKSGSLGNANLHRLHSSNITLGAIEKEKVSLVKSLFPPKEYMLRDYKYLEKHPYLLPLTWMLRIIAYGKNMDRKKNDPTKSIKIGERRVDLLKKYNIVKK